MNITDEQIDAIFGPSQFIARETMDHSKFEVVENTHPEWRSVIPSEGWVHHGYFLKAEDAFRKQRQLHVRRVLEDTRREAQAREP
jgi:hypothetical protein